MSFLKYIKALCLGGVIAVCVLPLNASAQSQYSGYIGSALNSFTNTLSGGSSTSSGSSVFAGVATGVTSTPNGSGTQPVAGSTTAPVTGGGNCTQIQAAIQQSLQNHVDSMTPTNGPQSATSQNGVMDILNLPSGVDPLADAIVNQVMGYINSKIASLAQNWINTELNNVRNSFSPALARVAMPLINSSVISLVNSVSSCPTMGQSAATATNPGVATATNNAMSSMCLSTGAVSTNAGTMAIPVLAPSPSGNASNSVYGGAP